MIVILGVLFPRLSRTPTMRVAALFVAVLSIAGPLEGQDPSPQASWPFGGGRGGRGQDLWNLGILGAKASDADRPPVPRGEGGMRRISGSDDVSLDRGPERLRVEILYEGGPAAEAGLAPGDVIVGVSRTPFAKGSVEPLADALRKAEAGDGVVTLLIEKAPRQRTTIRITVPKGGREALKPWAGTARSRTGKAACDWLAGRQGEDGGYPETLSGVNGAIVQTSLAGLAWLGASDAEGKGPYEAHVTKARDFVLRHLYDEDRGGLTREGGPNWNQTTWGLVHAGIFLGELAVRRPNAMLTQELTRLVAELGKRQEQSGGWAHGPGGKNALDYLELNIVTGLAMSALGAAYRAGIEVDSAVLDKAMAYMEASASGDGGVGYSTSPGQKGMGNIGRTAAAWLGAENAGLARHPFTPKMRNYVRRHSKEAFGGHASLMQHILLAGVAASAQGGEAWRDYTSAMEPELTLARAPDGSLQPRPWRESITMNSNSDVDTGQVWTTACWAVVLCADAQDGLGAGLPCWRGVGAKARK